MKPKKKPDLVAINQAIACAKSSLDALYAARIQDRFVDTESRERSIRSIARLEDELVTLKSIKHSRFNTGDPVKDAALAVLSIESEAGRKVSAQIARRAK